MTMQDFIEKEISVWGEDYVFDLMDRGYTPVLTDRGWYWLVTADVPNFKLAQLV